MSLVMFNSTGSKFWFHPNVWIILLCGPSRCSHACSICSIEVQRGNDLTLRKQLAQGRIHLATCETGDFGWDFWWDITNYYSRIFTVKARVIPVISTKRKPHQNRMYNPIYSQLYLINCHNCMGYSWHAMDLSWWSKPKNTSPQRQRRFPYFPWPSSQQDTARAAWKIQKLPCNVGPELYQL